jgi:two-component system, NarL family, invasion response regulator UvrY
MIKVLICDDHQIVRQGIRQMLADASDIALVAEADNGPLALKLVREANDGTPLHERLNVVPMDIAMPHRDGLDVLRQIRSEFPRLSVLMLSTYPDKQYAVRSLKLGAAGYLNKSADSETMTGAIRKVAAGGLFITPTVAEQLASAISAGRGHAPELPLHERLSHREYQVFRLPASGSSVGEIAEAEKWLQEVPYKGSLPTCVPTDPLIYRFYELISVYGTTFKALIHEEFGDGIMSAIDFKMDLKREVDPKGDRVNITMSGKFPAVQDLLGEARVFGADRGAPGFEACDLLAALVLRHAQLGGAVGLDGPFTVRHRHTVHRERHRAGLHAQGHGLRREAHAAIANDRARDRLRLACDRFDGPLRAAFDAGAVAERVDERVAAAQRRGIDRDAAFVHQQTGAVRKPAGGEQAGGRDHLIRLEGLAARGRDADHAIEVLHVRDLHVADEAQRQTPPGFEQVKAPRSWPKSSDSNSVSGIAAQFTLMNGASRRRLARCTARANSSLPVPESPSSSTLAAVCDTRSSSPSACSSAREVPTMP